MNAQTVRLRDEDLTLLLTLLRNATTPMTTAELMAVLRERASTG